MIFIENTKLILNQMQIELQNKNFYNIASEFRNRQHSEIKS